MNTLTKSLFKRAISILLVTIMVFSLGLVGLTSASAANTELAETGLSVNDNATLYCFNGYTNNGGSWDSGAWDPVKMSDNGTRSWQFAINDYPVNKGDIYFRFGGYLDGRNYFFFPGTNGDKIVAEKDKNVSPSNNAWEGTDHQGKAWRLSFEKLQSYSTVDVYIKFDNSNNSDGKAIVYVNDCKAATSVSNAVITVPTTDVVAGSSVTLKGSASVSNGSGSDTYVFTITDPTGKKTTTTSSTSSSYTFNPSVVGTYSCTVTVTNNGKSATSSSKTFTVVPAVEFSNVTITAPDSGIVGAPSVIQLGYDVEGSDSTPTYELLLNGKPCDTNWYTYDTTAKTVTVNPPVANLNYNFSVKITVDDISTTTDAVTIAYRDELSAKLDADNITPYVDDEFTLTVTDNSAQYGDATYELYCDSELVTDAKWDGNKVTVSSSASGYFTYYVIVKVDGANVDTNTLTIEVKEKIFNITLSSNVTSILENRDFTITATPEFAQGAVTYKLEATDGTLIEGNTDGIFNVTAKDVAENSGSEVITYKVTANDGTSEWVATIKITVNEDKGEFPVKIFFKCSDTFGYLPTAKINGEPVDLKVEGKICNNATDSATYSWYSYTSATDTPYGTEFVFAVNAKRNYFYNASYTVSAGEGDYEFDGTYYCYYLALENLNGGTNTLSNISKMSEVNRNWTESAVNMIYDAADALLPVAVNYSYAKMSDANTDGDINIKDATYIQKSLANMIEASEISQLVSDVNGDGKVTIKDATAIQKQLAGL